MYSLNNVLAASAIAFFTTTASGHMIMATPPPYGSPDNSPLVADGSNFPCKATSNSGGTVTNMAIGAPQKLSFLGESVHGGGSCQVSLTTDTPATKNSKWMVIHSIEGGCPAKNVAGNIGADNSAAAPDPDTYSFSIPTGVAPGAYTLAWTWFNKIGNREMYMNCASIKVTGGSSKRDTYLNETEFAIPELSGRDTPSFPPMFVANIPTSDCLTADSKDVQFPDPGTSVEKDGVASNLTPPTGPKCGSAGSSGSDTQAASSGGSSAGSGSSAAAAPSVASPAAAAPSVAASGATSPSAAAPVASAAAPDSQAAPAAGGASAAPSAAAAPAVASPATAPAASAAPASGSTSSSGSSSGGSSSSPGAMLCSSDGKQFAISPSGGTAPVYQPVAAGTTCTNGAIAAAKMKRSAKFGKGFSA
ncbi:hypothetical protein P7C71_g4265, partial [Lecanoromycetidae sp. Uapishka_2]